MRKGAALFWLFIVLGGGVYLSWRLYQGINFRADIMALVPREDQNTALSHANDSVVRSLSKKVVLLVGHEDRDQARAAGDEVLRTLSDSGLFEASLGGLDNQKLAKIGAFYFPYRYGLLSEEDRYLLQYGNARKIVERAQSQVFGLVGMANASLLKADPFLLMPRFLAGLPVPMSRLSLDDGQLTVQDGGKTWVLITGNLKGEPYALDVQKRFSDVLDSVVSSQQQAHPGLSVLRTGAVFFAKAGAEQAMNETSIIGIVSVAATVLLLLAAFRSLIPLFMCLLVIAVGMAMALSFSLWFWGEIHVCALLFGISLIGVTVDYSLQYCSEIFAPKSDDAFARMKKVFVGISLGAATTIIGYMTLFLAPFPGLRQIAMFSVVGLLASWVTVVLWLPFLDKTRKPLFGPTILNAMRKGLKFWESASYRFTRLALFGILLLACLVGFTRFHADDDVKKLQSLSVSLKAEQDKIQKLIGSTNGNQFFVIQATSDEDALQKEELLADRLRPLVGSGALTGFQSLASYIPSLARQAENRRILIEHLYKPFLPEQTAALGMSAMPEMPEEKASGLSLDNQAGLNEMFGFLSMLRPDRTVDGVLHVVTLEGVKDAAKIAESGEGIPDVRLIDPVHDFTLLFGKYRMRAVGLLILSAVLMLPLLAWRYGFQKGLGIMLPSVFAVVMTPPLCGLLGNAFTFFDAIALVLVFSIGTDYSIFYSETTEERKPVTMYAILLSACTAIMSFGFLAFSGVTAVNHFGLTMLIGVSLAFLFAPMPRNFTMKNNSAKALALLLVCFLSACASPSTVKDQTSSDPALVQIAPNLTLHMPSFHDLDRKVDVVQNVIAVYDGHVITFEGRINASPDHFTMACYDAIGRRVLSINWTDAGLTYESAPEVPSQLRPQNILADLVILYWPKNVVAKNIAPSGTLYANEASRSVSVDEKEILHSDYTPSLTGDLWSGKATYKNLAWNYSLTIDSKTLPTE